MPRPPMKVQEKLGKSWGRRKFSSRSNFPRRSKESKLKKNDHVIDGEIGSHSFICVYARVYVCVYQLERISVENSRDREQINRLVILTRSWPARSREARPLFSLSLSFVRSFVRSSLRTFEFYSPLLAGGKFCPGFGGELTRNNASRMLCQARNQVRRPVMEIPGKFLSRLYRSTYPKINLDKAIGSAFFSSFESLLDDSYFSFQFYFTFLRNAFY